MMLVMIKKKEKKKEKEEEEEKKRDDVIKYFLNLTHSGHCKNGLFLHEFFQDMIDMHHWEGGQRSGMNLPVAYEASLLGERLAAHVANVNPFAGVEQQMLAQTAVRGERSGAHRTTVRLVPGVYPHVLPEIVVLEERFPALLANGLLLLLVLGQHVLVKVLFRHQSSVAHRALVLRLVVGVFLMCVQTVTVATRFAANVAHDRRLPMIQPHVGGQITLDLELFAALLARELVMLGVLPYEMRPQRLLSRADEAAYDASEFSFTGEFTLPF